MTILLGNRAHGKIARRGGFTLVEVLIVSVLLVILVVATWSSLVGFDVGAARNADTAAVMAAMQAEMEKVRAKDYNPPLSPFTTSTVTQTNVFQFSQDSDGTNFVNRARIVIEYKPIATGHLVTICGRFTTMGMTMAPSIQTVINDFSKPQQ